MKCLAKKIIFPIITAAAFAIIASLSQYLVWQVLFFEVVTDEAFDGLWRPMNDPLWQYGMPVVNFIYGISFLVAYTLLSGGLTWCNKKFLKGVKFGLIIWLFMGVTGGLIWFIIHPINMALMAATMVDHLITLTIGGGVVSLIYDKCCNSCKPHTTLM